MSVMVRAIMLISVSWFTAAAPLQYLTKVLVSETSFESPSTNWNASDDDSVRINIGFNFPFNNTTYDRVWINSNGMLSFSSSNTAYSNTGIPYNQEAQSIYPYWDDMNRNSGGTIRYETLGNASNRHLVISWNSVPHYSNTGSYSFQVVLYEDGGIRFRYDATSDANGNSNGGATIGVQEDTSHYDEHSDNNAITQTQDILYIPNPISITPTASTCTKVQQIGLSTYDTNGYGDNYADSAAEFQTWITDNATDAKRFDNGYIDKIDVTSSSNNNPYYTGTDQYYLAIFSGYIYLPDSGTYKFGIDGDDAVEVYIDGTLVTGWYGGHGRASHATHVTYVNASSGYHKIEFHMQERTGGDNYYLYWQPPTGSSIVIVPSAQYFHCIPSVTKTSCVISDPVNNITNPKRIPGGTIRYAIEVYNQDDIVTDSNIITDDVSTDFEQTTIGNLRIGSGACNCVNPGVTSANGPGGTGNGVNPVKLDFESIAAHAKECGYFEVDIR